MLYLISEALKPSKGILTCLARAACSCSDLVVPQKVAKRVKGTSKPLPATVSKYDAHILLRLPYKKDHTYNGCQWPAVVEKEPAFVKVFSNLAKFPVNVDEDSVNFKVTAYEPLDGGPKLNGDECGLILFPHGAEYLRLKIEQIPLVLQLHLTDVSTRERHELENYLPTALDCHNIMHLLVCCHGSRDYRCGKIGPQVASELHRLALSTKVDSSVRVVRCSHVGGHEYAGNVMIYYPQSKNDGDWFGGITLHNCKRLFDGLVTPEIGDESGLENTVLRNHWRGRMGLTKAEQLNHWKKMNVSNGVGEIERIEERTEERTKERIEDMTEERIEERIEEMAGERIEERIEEIAEERIEAGDSPEAEDESDSSDEANPLLDIDEDESDIEEEM